MDESLDTIAELTKVTREMEDAEEPEGEAFGTLMKRRGELLGALCFSGFDASDERVAGLVRGGEKLLAKIYAWRDSLRAQAESLDRTAILVGGVRATLHQPRSGLNISA